MQSKRLSTIGKSPKTAAGSSMQTFRRTALAVAVSGAIPMMAPATAVAQDGVLEEIVVTVVVDIRP